MTRIDKCAEILHDLLLIQQQRIHFYQELLAQHSPDSGTTRLLRNISYASQAFALSIRRRLDVNLGDPADHVDIKGDIYEQWNRQQVLDKNQPVSQIAEQCEQIERTTENLYLEALSACSELSHESKNLIVNHMKRIRRIISENREGISRPSAPVFSDIENGPRIYREERVAASTA